MAHWRAWAAGMAASVAVVSSWPGGASAAPFVGDRIEVVDVQQVADARGDLTPNLPSMRCVGYRQAWDYLDGKIDRAGLRETGIIATRQLAKRQLTWLRAMPERIVIDCLGRDPSGALLDQVRGLQKQQR